MPLSIGQVLNNRYRIDALLGQGGMGAVYRAWDMGLDISVAVKENLDTSPEAQKQFSREAKLLAHLSHPNLPRVTDHFFVPGQGQYLVMDYVEGEDLAAMLKRLGALPELGVVNWTLQVCDALAYLHSQSAPVIHRDIKPANIKIRPDGRAMLVDFGIAKIYDPYLSTTIGAKAVTPGYSPPEQYGGGTTDTRSDIYALGATLYHLLTGQVPPESVQRAVGAVTLPPPRQLNRQISPATEQAILKATEVATDRRFQNVNELCAALTQPVEKAVVPPTLLVTVPVRKEAKEIETAPSRALPMWGLIAGGLVLLVLVVIIGAAARGRGAAIPVATSTVKVAAVLPTTLTVALPASTLRPTATPVPPTETQTPIPPTQTLVPSATLVTPTYTPSSTPKPSQTLTRAPTSTPTSVHLTATISPAASGPTIVEVSRVSTGTRSMVVDVTYVGFENKYGWY